MILTAAALIWLGAYVLRGSILWGCAGFLFATCCLGHEFFNVTIGTQVTIDRAGMLVLCGIAVVQRLLGLHDPKPWGKTEWLLTAFLLLLTVHVLVVEEGFGRGNMSAAPYWHLIVGYLFPVGLYFLARQATLDKHRVLEIHAFLIGFGIYLGLTGVLEMSKQWWAVWPGYIADEKVGLHYGRARGPMVQSVSYGLYVSVCFGAALLALASWPLKGKLLVLPASGLMLVAAVLTLTRSVWLGTAAVLLTVIWYCMRDPWRKYIVYGCLGIGLVLVAFKFESITGFPREGSIEDTRSSAECRAQFAYVSWLMFLDRPIFGFGFGNFPEEKLPYLDLRDVEMNMDLIRPLIHHNTYLDLLVELGLVGCALYLAIMIAWTRTAWRLTGDPRRPNWVRYHGILTLAALGSYAIQMMFHEVTFTSIDNSLIFLLAGISSGLFAQGERPSERTEKRWASERAENRRVGQAVDSVV